MTRYLKHFHIVVYRMLPWNAFRLIKDNGLFGWILGLKQPWKDLYQSKPIVEPETKEWQSLTIGQRLEMLKRKQGTWKDK